MPLQLDPLPCPFCGRQGKVRRDDSASWYVECTRRQKAPCPCSPRTDIFAKRDDAVAAWNTRVEAK